MPREVFSEASGTPLERRSRLLFIYDGEFDQANGVSNYIRTIGDYAAEQGVDVHYLVGKASSQEPNTSSISKTIPIHANDSRSLIPAHTSRAELANLLDSFDPDVAHVQMPFLPALSGKALKELKRDVTLVGTFHTPMPHGWLLAANKANARLSKKKLQQFDHFYSVSEVAQLAAKKVYGIDSEILPCPINLNQIRNATSEKLPFDNDKTVITFLGRIVARKGLGIFLDSIDLLDPDIREKLAVRVIGDGADRNKFEDRAANSAMADKIRFLGTLDGREKQEALARSDIALYPSIGGESFGIVLAEAMAVGKPVVLASNIAGYSEVLSNTPSALVAGNDPGIFASRITQIVTYPEFRASLFAAQQKIVKKFDIHKVIGPKLMQDYGIARSAT